MKIRLVVFVLSWLVIIGAVAPCFAQSDDCVRVREVRWQAENQLMVLLSTSPLQQTTAEMAAAAAKALGLTIPQSVLGRADEVIQ